MARTWQLRNERWQLPEMGALMGILNVTPDSFSDGGNHFSSRKAVAHAVKLMKQGADMIDIGGESTRPGATPVSPKEEQRRILPVIRALRRRFPAHEPEGPRLRISVDTMHPDTALKALEEGADVINDITGLTNPDMLSLCAEHDCGIVLMHMKGHPFRTEDCPLYFDVVAEVRRFFEERLDAAEAAGISLSRICLDPGIGFNKKLEHNLALIHGLAKVRARDLPLLMGLSRKRFIGEYFGNPEAAKHDHEPTVAMSMLAADNGAEIHRVHDVAPHRQALQIRMEMARSERGS